VTGALGFGVWLACRSAPTPVAAPEPVGLTEGVMSVHQGLSDARRSLAADDRGGAARALRQTYSEHFEPLEDKLRATDAQTTFELEFAFGALAHDLDGHTEGPEIDARLQDLDRRVQDLADRVALAEVSTTQ